MSYGWWILIGIWILLSLIMVVFVRIITSSSTKYLRAPSPNFMTKCKAAARYDFVNLNTKELYFSALFVFPLRISCALALILFTTLIVLIAKLMFCGRYRIMNSNRFKQSETKRKDICVGDY